MLHFDTHWHRVITTVSSWPTNDRRADMVPPFLKSMLTNLRNTDVNVTCMDRRANCDPNRHHLAELMDTILTIQLTTLVDVLNLFISVLCHSDWLFHWVSCPDHTILIVDTVKARKLAYYRHTMRKQGSCLEKEITPGTMPDACRQERPCMAWTDHIKTWTGLPMKESIRMTRTLGTEING